MSGAAALAAIVLFAAACSHSPAAASAQSRRVAATPIDMSTAGTITGVVRFTGTPPAMPVLDMSGATGCASAGHAPARDQAVVVNANHTLRWAFVYIAAGLESYHFDAPSRPVPLVQQGCQFQPHVLGLMPGQPLEIFSRDPVPHNVFADPRQNPRWNISMMPGAAPVIERFAQPEVMIPVACNVHPWMHAYVGVVASPYFAVTDGQGTFTLPRVPPGSYTLEVWQQRYGLQRRQVDVLPRQQVRVVFTYSAGGA